MKQLRSSTLSLVNVKTEAHDEHERVFKYELNEKRAKANILKGAKRSKHIETEVKTGCINVRFSDGAYQKIVLPLLKKWIGEINKEFVVNDSKIKILDAEEGKDLSARHMDTKIIALFDQEKIVIHAYNSTQNVMIQGKPREKFVFNFFEPLFQHEIELSLDSISKFNEDVKESLGSKKINKSSGGGGLNCPYCSKKYSSKSNLRTDFQQQQQRWVS